MSKLIAFLKESKAEVAKVTWPDRKVTVASTGVVLAVSLIVGLYLGLLDVILTKVFDLLY